VRALNRVPLTDYYWTTDGTIAAFQARSVVGSIYIKMLADRETRKCSASRAGELASAKGSTRK